MSFPTSVAGSSENDAADVDGAAPGVTDGDGSSGNSEGGSGGTDLRVAVPMSILIGWGIARAAASGLQELRNAIFASVAQVGVMLCGIGKSV
jgi:hypothetical protein